MLGALEPLFYYPNASPPYAFPSKRGRVVQGTSHCAEATTLCADGSAGAGQWTVTGTWTQTSTGTCRQIVRGTQTVRHSVTCRLTVTGQWTVVVTGTWRHTV